MWKNQVEKLRNERVHDFAPPKIYDNKRKWPKLNEQKGVWGVYKIFV